MRRMFSMRDYLTVRSRDVVDHRKLSDSTESLLVHVKATHSGIVNGNRRFYRPDKMASSTHTWMPIKGHYSKPVLIGHDLKGPVMGRVLEAKYVDESFKYKNDHVDLRDSVFYCADGKKKLDLFRSIDWIVDNLMTDKEYAGLGYIDLGLKITNPEAVRKVLEDEFLTVSVSMKTDAAICSICHMDWAGEGEKCSHELGQVYDDKPMFLITGNFLYQECSFVNFPADPFAGVVSKKTLTDSLEKMFFLGLPLCQQQSMPHAHVARMADAYGLDIEIVEGEMPKKPNDSQTEVEIASLEDEVSAEERAAAAENLEAELKSGTEVADEAIEDWEKFQLTPEDITFFGQGADAIYTALATEIDAARKAGELTDEQMTGALGVEDGKLSSEQRTKLKGSTFCGPNRSFPVPDCAHVTAARRLIGRATVSDSTKSKILGCVSRKASALGCEVKDEKPVTPAAGELCDEVKAAGVSAGLDLADADKSAASVSAQCLNHYQGVYGHYKGADDNLKYKIAGVHRAMGEHMSTHDMLDYYKKRLTEHKDFVVLTPAEHDELVSAKDQRDAAQKDAQTMRDQATSVLANYKKGLAQTIIMHKVLSGAEGFKDLTDEQLQTKVKDLSRRSVSSLKDTVSDTLSELKWVAPTKVPMADESPETEVRQVNDNVKITEPAAPAVTALADQAKAQQDAMLLQARLSAMTPAERMICLADLLYKPAASKTK